MIAAINVTTAGSRPGALSNKRLVFTPFRSIGDLMSWLLSQLTTVDKATVLPDL